VENTATNGIKCGFWEKRYLAKFCHDNDCDYGILYRTELCMAITHKGRQKGGTYRQLLAELDVVSVAVRWGRVVEVRELVADRGDDVLPDCRHFRSEWCCKIHVSKNQLRASGIDLLIFKKVASVSDVEMHTVHPGQNWDGCYLQKG